MANPLTADEHHLRAALLGMRYIEHYGFYTSSEPGSGLRDPGIRRLDATTLEPIDADEVKLRHMMW